MKEKEQIQLTKAQTSRLIYLFSLVKKAEKDFNDFLTYVAEEHEIPENEKWTLSQDATMLIKDENVNKV